MQSEKNYKGLSKAKYAKYRMRAYRPYLGVILLLNVSFLFAGPWPGQLPGTEIGDSLPAGYEPSGAVWHVRLNKFLTVWDNGMVSMMDYDGTDITNWSVPGDLEGICIADPTTDFVYVGLERPEDGIKEFNIVSGQVTRFFDLTPWMQSVDPNLGLEALTFVPDTTNPEGGLFYAGLQQNSNIYIFQLPIKSSTTDTHVTYIDMMNPVGGRINLSGFDYERNSGILYAIWSYGVHKIRAMEIDGTNIVEWDLIGDSQEGIALWEGLGPGQRQIFIAEDAGEVWRYDFNSDVEVTIIGNGSVMLEPDPPSYYGTYEILNAVADSGHQFLEWSGDLTGNANPETLLMDYDKEVTATFEAVGIEEQKSTIKPAIALTVNPNPFSEITKISFSNRVDYRQKRVVSLQIFDVTGKLVKQFDHTTIRLSDQIIWNGTDNHGQRVPPGIFFCELKVRNCSLIEKIVFLK